METTLPGHVLCGSVPRAHAHGIFSSHVPVQQRHFGVELSRNHRVGANPWCTSSANPKRDSSREEFCSERLKEAMAKTKTWEEAVDPHQGLVHVLANPDAAIRASSRNICVMHSD